MDKEAFEEIISLSACCNGGDCDRKAEEMAQKFGKEGMPTLDVESKCRQWCGRVTGVKLCGGLCTDRSVVRGNSDFAD